MPEDLHISNQMGFKYTWKVSRVWVTCDENQCECACDEIKCGYAYAENYAAQSAFDCTNAEHNCGFATVSPEGTEGFVAEQHNW